MGNPGEKKILQYGQHTKRDASTNHGASVVLGQAVKRLTVLPSVSFSFHHRIKVTTFDLASNYMLNAIKRER